MRGKADRRSRSARSLGGQGSDGTCVRGKRIEVTISCASAGSHGWRHGSFCKNLGGRRKMERGLCRAPRGKGVLSRLCGRALGIGRNAGFYPKGECRIQGVYNERAARRRKGGRSFVQNACARRGWRRALRSGARFAFDGALSSDPRAVCLSPYASFW